MEGALLPKGCVTIANAVDLMVGEYCDLVGVVVDFRPPVTTRGTDWMATLTLCDTSRALPETSLTIRIFRPNPDLLPEIKSDSDLILIRRVKIIKRDGHLLAMSTFDTNWIISYAPTHPKSLPLTSSYPSSLKIKADEQAYFQGLRVWWKFRRESFVARGAAPSTYSSSQVNNSSNRRRKTGLIRDMEIGSFYDLAGVVVKTFPGNGNYTVYLTDYTKNPMLHSYEWGGSRRIGAGGDDDDFDYTGRGRSIGNQDWPGPWGQYTLQVTLWDIHAVAANRLLYLGAHVSLQNVRAKRNGDGKLEGTLNGDREFPDKVLVSLIKNMDDPRVKQIAIRCKEYTRRFESDKQRFEEEMARKEMEVNLNIRALKASQPITPISEIAEPQDIDRPFANRIHKIHCRVVDYLPPKLEDFAVLETGHSVWIWRFALLVEGEDGATLRVIVEGNDAEYLLVLPAANLRKDQQALSALREKLFILWGNLEEVKSQQLKSKPLKGTATSYSDTAPGPPRGRKRIRKRRYGNQKQVANKQLKYDELGRPSNADRDADDNESQDENEVGVIPKLSGKMFEACLKEYGVQNAKGEWKRLHKLFGTLIL
ncbi:hypothetical protein L873DRAFT_1717083 [Choiromyces venosus 120613-1]|uniref:Protection of telomeres protein 1 n=1 Tax=Choiromyces venosus 120613-1 TaxID=1336337 RepID=A0A3N4IWR4_9PEZI|nr:hypothetical protein L873DRAFT_1717083 [Choiromyces venosus 120613-1]